MSGSSVVSRIILDNDGFCRPPHPARGVYPEPLRFAQGRSQRNGERARHPLSPWRPRVIVNSYAGQDTSDLLVSWLTFGTPRPFSPANLTIQIDIGLSEKRATFGVRRESVPLSTLIRRFISHAFNGYADNRSYGMKVCGCGDPIAASLTESALSDALPERARRSPRLSAENEGSRKLRAIRRSNEINRE